MIVADTGAIIALIDANDRHHSLLSAHFARDPGAWVLPWAILPEVDYLLLKHFGATVERLFCRDVVAGTYRVERLNDRDVARAAQLNERYAELQLGLVDGVVMAVAERLKAREIATLDIRDFSAVKLAGAPRLIPRDL